MVDKRDENSTERNDPNPDAYLAALKRERAGYVASGDADRLAAVDAELAKAGDPVERAVSSAPEKSEPVKKAPARKATTRKAKA